MISAYLRYQRATLAMKCTGLNAAELARRSNPPSKLSLLGLLRHAAEVERIWFRTVMAGQEAPPRFFSATDPDGEFDGAEAHPALVTQAWQVWRAEVEFSERFVDEAPDLDIMADSHGQGMVSLRWVLLHMLEEYARHNGHADLLREQIDGAVGE
ncbi:MAG: hypothetical protein QOF00_310 [Pseudonocardiales bacterium]|jgi:uncharacterized damage-inducible protein DinB|nr:hypothetical protein [Pseudonocardiales bacterium]